MYTSSNNNPAGPCVNPPSGTTTEYDEGIDIDQSRLHGGAKSGDGGISAINPNFLVRDQNVIRSIRGTLSATIRYTVLSMPRTDTLPGPTSIRRIRPWAVLQVHTNVDDYYLPKINSNTANFAAEAPPQLTISECLSGGVPTLPDQSVIGDDYNGSFQNIQCYDGLKVSAILNEIDGKNHDGTAPAPVPTIFGMNFQAVSIGQKLIYQHGSLQLPYTTKGGYTDSIGTPNGSLLQEIKFVDSSIGLMVAELKKEHLINSTLIIITAKHGQSPVDSSRYKKNGPPNDPASILVSCIFPSENPNNSNVIGPTEDDVALLWLN
jgi:hypothetical protein